MRYLLLILVLLMSSGCTLPEDTSTETPSVDTTPGVFIGDTYDDVWCAYGPPDESEDGVWFYKRLGNSRYGALLYFDEDGILYQVRLTK